MSIKVNGKNVQKGQINGKEIQKIVINGNTVYQLAPKVPPYGIEYGYWANSTSKTSSTSYTIPITTGAKSALFIVSGGCGNDGYTSPTVSFNNLTAKYSYNNTSNYAKIIACNIPDGVTSTTVSVSYSTSRYPGIACIFLDQNINSISKKNEWISQTPSATNYALDSSKTYAILFISGNNTHGYGNSMYSLYSTNPKVDGTKLQYRLKQNGTGSNVYILYLSNTSSTAYGNDCRLIYPTIIKNSTKVSFTVGRSDDATASTPSGVSVLLLEMA